MLAYGEEIVWQCGLKALGYPPTWAHQVHEANRVHEEIKSYFEANPGLLMRLQDSPLEPNKC